MMHQYQTIINCHWLLLIIIGTDFNLFVGRSKNIHNNLYQMTNIIEDFNQSLFINRPSSNPIYLAFFVETCFPIIWDLWWID